MFDNNLLNFLIDTVDAFSLDDGREVLDELVFEPARPVETLFSLLLRHLPVDAHDELDVPRLDEHRHGVDARRLQALDRVPAHVENTVLALLRHRLHARDARAVQVVVVLARLDELVVLDVGFHCLATGDEVVVPPVNLVLASGKINK